MNYSPSTIARIGDINRGLLVETTETSYLNWGVTVQASLFTVYDRIMILGLWGEVGATTLAGAGALFGWTFASTVPVVAAAALSAVSTSIDGFVTGRRISLAGTSVATAASVNGTAGISVGPVTFMVVGHMRTAAGVQRVGQIGCLTTTAVLTAGTAKFSLLYVPIDDGAYVEALL